MQYLSRICFNQSGWTRPDGSAVGMERNTFYSQFGHGHEEWLFRSEWQIDGWRYGFLQGVNNSRASLQGQDELYEVTLFTHAPEGRRYVAVIHDLECLSYEQSEAVFKEFEVRGWIAQMQQEVTTVGGQNAEIPSYEWLNVRFRLAQVEWYSANTFPSETDYVHHLKRYQMNRAPAGAVVATPESDPLQRKAAVGELNTQSFYRSGSPGRECTPEHKIMQNLLAAELEKEFPGRVAVERSFVDVSVETEYERILYEIKSDLSVRTVMRLALGQLLEYAFRSVSDDPRPQRLVMVGRTAMSAEDLAYLDYLRVRFQLPLEYRQVRLP